MKLIDHKSPEKDIINDAFNSLTYMDMWISSIVEGYEKVEQDYIYKDEEDWD